jgi:hypothetical protein
LAFSRSSTSSDPSFSPARQMYFTAFPKQKLRCSVIWIHSTPLG